jgi:hypothetical protein
MKLHSKNVQNFHKGARHVDEKAATLHMDRNEKEHEMCRYAEIHITMEYLLLFLS